MALWVTNLRNPDDYPYVHAVNVCVLTLGLCHSLGFERGQLLEIGVGALLHDIGQARTPTHILDKPGQLTREEFDIMQRHPEDGYRMMLAAGRLTDLSLAIIRSHHERIAGTGYPDQLTATAIATPVLATAIVDVYDALVSDRRYRQGLPADVAIQAMYQNAESNYGRELMQAFIRFIGVYPVGCVVELDNGGVGLVVSAREHARLLPRVLLIRDADGSFLEQRRLIDLTEADTTGGWYVRRVVSSSDLGLDVAAIIRAECLLPG
jgi:putative nucleotidyltransferase with HDIG domain